MFKLINKLLKKSALKHIFNKFFKKNKINVPCNRYIMNYEKSLETNRNDYLFLEYLSLPTLPMYQTLTIISISLNKTLKLVKLYTNIGIYRIDMDYWEMIEALYNNISKIELDSAYKQQYHKFFPQTIYIDSEYTFLFNMFLESHYESYYNNVRKPIRSLFV